jgi:hypothetical protein
MYTCLYRHHAVGRVDHDAVHVKTGTRAHLQCLIRRLVNDVYNGCRQRTGKITVQQRPSDPLPYLVSAGSSIRHIKSSRGQMTSH